jgi:hypothetical protein
MKLSNVCRLALGPFILTVLAVGSPVTLKVNSHNFQLDQGGGGASAMLNGTAVEIFCDDFAHDMIVPSTNSANVTTLGTNADLSETRFGGVTQWTHINLVGSDPTTNKDRSYLNSGAGDTASARYAMAAYLVSLYKVGAGSNSANNTLQQAIWTLLDPKSEGAVPNPKSRKITNDLEAAVAWYENMDTPGNLSALNAFLGGFEVLSPTSMIYSKGLGSQGFQEQIVMTATPEPAEGAAMLVGLLLLGGAIRRRRLAFTSQADKS